MLNFFSNLMNNGGVQSDALTGAMPIIRYVLFGVMIACAVVMIVTTLMQQNESNGSLDAFTGTKQESYYSQNKGASRDAILKRITIAMAIVLFVCVITFFVTELVAGLR